MAGKKDVPKMSTKDKVTVALAELIGTGILVFLGCMGCVSTLTPHAPSHLQISFTFGFAVMLIIQIFGHVSGSHLNPAVTVAAVILGELKDYMLAPLYIGAQIVGACLGFALLKAVTPAQFIDGAISIDPNTNMSVRAPGVCSTIPNPEISSLQALVVEIAITLVLILVCAGVWDNRNKTKHDSVPIRFGLTIAGLAMAGGPWTGASMNPARSFAPALINWDWEQHWVYWLGPILAALVGGGGYRAVFTRPEPEAPQDTHEAIPLTTTNHEKTAAHV